MFLTATRLRSKDAQYWDHLKSRVPMFAQRVSSVVRDQIHLIHGKLTLYHLKYFDSLSMDTILLQKLKHFISTSIGLR